VAQERCAWRGANKSNEKLNTRSEAKYRMANNLAEWHNRVTLNVLKIQRFT
jgi:hypothetical protein